MMDAVEYLKTLNRMCHCECLKCEFGKARSGFETCPVWQRTHPEEAVAIMEKWAAAHPIKTRMSVFLEQWPDARIHRADGLPFVSPCYLVNKTDPECTGTSCPKCRKAFWLEEVEE